MRPRALRRALRLSCPVVSHRCPRPGGGEARRRGLPLLTLNVGVCNNMCRRRNKKEVKHSALRCFEQPRVACSQALGAEIRNLTSLAARSLVFPRRATRCKRCVAFTFIRPSASRAAKRPPASEASLRASPAPARRPARPHNSSTRGPSTPPREPTEA